MKVGMVCPYDWSHPGGVRSHITGLAKALRKRGVEVEIIAPSSLTEDEIFSVGRPVPIAVNGSVARIALSARSWRRTGERLGRGDLDLLHLHEPAVPGPCLFALIRGKLPKVATFHASAPRSLAYLGSRPVLAPQFAKLAGRIAVSGAALDLVSLYFSGPFRIIPNGVDVAAWALAPTDQALGETKPFVLFVGRPEPRKGLDVLVKAMQIVRSRSPVGLVVVGPDARDVPSWATALGPVTPARLAGILKTADLFCAPSLGGESFGIVLVEAFAAGTPVICSALPGYVEAAGNAALLTPPGDAGELAETIETLLATPSRAHDLVRLGRQRADQLDWEILVEDVIEVYDEAL